MISQSISRICETCQRGWWNTTKKDGGAMMVVFYTIAEFSYLVVGSLNDLVRPHLF